jgi:hypothetical protein
MLCVNIGGRSGKAGDHNHTSPRRMISASAHVRSPHLAAGLKQLSGVFMNFHFAHFHHRVLPRGGHPRGRVATAECVALTINPRRRYVFATRPRRRFSVRPATEEL